MTQRTFIGLARRFALEHHGDQRYGDLPYEFHLQAVVNVLLDTASFRPELENMVAAAWLHDVIEDTPVTELMVKEEFGPEVAAIVWACSGVGKNRKERNASIYEKIGMMYAGQRREGASVKVADRIANVENSAPDSHHRKMYREERAAFWNAVARYASPVLQQRLDAAYDKE